MNLFEKAGYSPEQINRKVEETWDALFSGPHKIYFQDPGDTGYMVDTGNNDVRSEGMSYGMMMAVQMDRRDVFNRLWKWAHTHMLMTIGIHEGYFAWSCQTDGTKNAFGPAPDGEEYFAMALFFASARWGDGESPFDYGAQAREILSSCLHNHERNRKHIPDDGGSDEEIRQGFPMWDGENHLIKFIPEADFTDPSYHLPHFYEIFAQRANAEDRGFWSKAAHASRDFLTRACHPITGLAPEYSYYDGRPYPHFEECHMDFFSDAYRVAANIGLDALWFGRKPWQQEIIDKILGFFRDKRREDYRVYAIDGTPLPDRGYLHDIGLLATNAMGALATDADQSLEVVMEFWETPPRIDDRRYYDNCLYFFTVLALSGRYVIY